MAFEHLWAPWRLGYIIKGPEEPAKVERPLNWRHCADHNCFICHAVADSADRENLVIQRGTNTVTILNRFPYNNGHLLIAPIYHKARLDELNSEEMSELMQTISAFTAILEREMKAEGFNVGLNLGRVAGAGLPGHLHWHIVPRWNGDTNFMPSLGAVRVIPQSLDELWQLLRDKLPSTASQDPAP